MKILHVITGLGKAAGTTTFVENVVAELRKRGHEVDVLTVAADDGPWRRKKYDIVHLHALWTPWLHRVAKWARQKGVPVVWSTHGMTAPWSMRHKWWKKIIAWWLYQKWDLKRAAAIHCTTDLEVDWNNKLGFKNCIVAPLGTNLPPMYWSNTQIVGQSSVLKVLFVGRIYPVKGLVNLVRAAAIIKQSSNQNNQTILFRIVGPDQAGHQAELLKLAKDLNVSDMFEWPGPKFGEELSSEYDSCDLLILPSFTENFGGVVIDALAHGKPVIASEFTPWKILNDEHCGWWVDNDPDSLSAVLSPLAGSGHSKLLDVRVLLQEMGRQGRNLVEDCYTWSAVCDKMIASYEELLRR